MLLFENLDGEISSSKPERIVENAANSFAELSNVVIIRYALVLFSCFLFFVLF